MANLPTSVFHDHIQNNNDDEAIQPVHAQEGCGCGLLGPSNSTINNSTQEGNVIFFSVHRYGPSSCHLERAEIHASEDAWPPFVAFSHVRMNGLGNSRDNKLPSCQLSVLQSFVNKLQPNGTVTGTFFWIDTLCLPVPRELRKQAYLLQPLIYSRAQQVLVLDPPISQWPFRSPGHALIRIRDSDWKGRLWTLLEGFLARNLVFLFSNRLVDLDEILEDFDKSNGEVTAYCPVLQRDLNPELDRLPMSEAEIVRAMKPFTRDIMIWASEAERRRTDPVNHRQVDQAVLYTQLRLGCLSSPKFRFLVERYEAREIPSVCQALIEVYGSYIYQRPGDHDQDVVANLARMSMLGKKRMELLSK